MIEPRVKYRIMSFNIQRFSDNSAFHRQGVDSKKDLDTISRIIRDNNIDIVAIQEIRGKIAFKELLSAIAFGYSKDITFKMLEQPTANGNPCLKSELAGENGDYLACTAGKWQGRWAHPNSKWGTAISEEGYAFIWNTERVYLPNNERGIIQPVIKHKKEAYFVRPPFYGRFLTKTTAKFEIRLLNAHILYTTDAKFKKIKELGLEAYVELLNSPNKEERMEVKKTLLSKGLTPVEVDVLEKTLNQKDVPRRRMEVVNMINEILAKDEDDKGFGSYVFMIGDYNLNLVNAHGNFKNRVATIGDIVIYGAGTKNDVREYVITQEELSTLRLPPKEGQPPLVGEERFANNYDHVTYNKAMTLDGPGGRSIYVSKPVTINVIDNYGMTNKEYFERVSDHLPIFFEIGF